jgi:carbamoyl-phosphate synthase large subunit
MCKKINVLFVGGGRRISLAERFIEKNCNIISYEYDINSPISKISTVIKGESWKSESIIPHLCNVCLSNKIDLLIPLQDEGVSIVSKSKLNSPVSNLDICNICLDKIKFENVFINDSDLITYYPLNDFKTDCIVKPRFGFGSRGIEIKKQNELKNINLNDNVIQKYINSKIEITVDCYFNKNSKLIGAVPRYREIIAGGEVLKSITFKKNDILYNRLIKSIEIISDKIKFVGPICIQYIVDDSGKLWIMEINARFGGGVILSLQAGFNIIGMIIDEYVYNKNVSDIFSDWTENMVMHRYFSEHFYIKGT